MLGGVLGAGGPVVQPRVTLSGGHDQPVEVVVPADAEALPLLAVRQRLVAQDDTGAAVHRFESMVSRESPGATVASPSQP